MAGQQIVTCPKCGGSKVMPKADGVAYGLGLIFAGILAISLGIWIPIIGWFIVIPAGPIMAGIGIVLIIVAILVKIGRKKPTHKKFICEDKDCSHSFKVDIEKAKELEKFLK